MADDVYANNMSLVHKGSSGKALACFPDVCLCPPTPPAGPIPTPLPNNAMASDVDDCAKSVLVDGNPVAHSDSVIKTSAGDEPGDPKSGGQGGVVTHCVKGKAKFASHSMDVQVEGKPVVRHLDMTTHNHSNPANAAVQAMTAKQTFADKGVVSCGEDCTVSTYDPNKCPTDPKTGKKKTPHHMVPKHCFKEFRNGPDGKPIPYTPKGGASSPWGGYNPNKAPCICVSGEDKSDSDSSGQLLDHGRIHDAFDLDEAIMGLRNNEANEWTLKEANDAACKCVAAVVPGCNKECLAAIIDDYHAKNDESLKDTKIRAYCPKSKRSELRKGALDALANQDHAAVGG